MERYYYQTEMNTMQFDLAQFVAIFYELINDNNAIAINNTKKKR